MGYAGHELHLQFGEALRAARKVKQGRSGSDHEQENSGADNQVVRASAGNQHFERPGCMARKYFPTPAFERAVVAVAVVPPARPAPAGCIRVRPAAGRSRSSGAEAFLWGSATAIAAKSACAPAEDDIRVEAEEADGGICLFL